MADKIYTEWYAARDDFLFAWRMYVPTHGIVHGRGKAYSPALLAELVLTRFTSEGQGYALDDRLERGERAGLEPITNQGKHFKATARAKLCLSGLFDIYPHLEGILRPLVERMLVEHRKFWSLADAYYTYDHEIGPLKLQSSERLVIP